MEMVEMGMVLAEAEAVLAAMGESRFCLRGHLEEQEEEASAVWAVVEMALGVEVEVESLMVGPLLQILLVAAAAADH